ncbi:mitochondrial FAD-linked sulfhydryl oxidase ERV1 [Lentinula edodes]|uniref:Sulfhydryl oxidase n=1 Tax=Lentinula edodes TaxID=5353 RepID=A0A1Q3DUJ5_LENED|nr:mitochondrial FAD-linked sulfhydryl oxidase ERV1 [Lentinula edodes]
MTQEQSHNKTVASGAATTLAASSASASRKIPPTNCPPDSEELGHATWTFLHTTAAYYPTISVKISS